MPYQLQWRYHALNRPFHEAIYAGTHNRYLMEQAQSLYSRLAPYRPCTIFQGADQCRHGRRCIRIDLAQSEGRVLTHQRMRPRKHLDQRR